MENSVAITQEIKENYHMTQLSHSWDISAKEMKSVGWREICTATFIVHEPAEDGNLPSPRMAFYASPGGTVEEMFNS